MALDISIKINQKDARASYGMDVLTVEKLDSPTLTRKGFQRAWTSGEVVGVGLYGARTIKIAGEIRQTTHALLLAAIDAFKKDTGAEYYGMRQFRLAFTDLSDRYFMATLLEFKMTPVGSPYTAADCQFEFTVQIDDPFGVYDTLTLTNVAGSPFSSPFSTGYVYNGSAICRPRIMLENSNAANITSITLVNTACKARTREITVTTANIPRTTGRWNDVRGAASFVAASAPDLHFTGQGNFNAGCFTIFMYVWWVAGGTSSSQYYFSTTGNTVRLYHDVVNSKIVFDVNGTAIEILDSASGFTTGKWFAIAASYAGAGIANNLNLSIYDTVLGVLTIVEPGSVTYRGLPTTVYIGTDASGLNVNNKNIDDVRLFNYVLNGMGANPNSGSELESYYLAEGPLPIARGCTCYLPFDYKANAVAMENTSLVIADTLAQNGILDINCEDMVIRKLGANFTAAPASIMDKVTGEFPFLVPGTNGIQVVHDGAVSSVLMAIEDKRRFL